MLIVNKFKAKFYYCISNEKKDMLQSTIQVMLIRTLRKSLSDDGPIRQLLFVASRKILKV